MNLKHALCEALVDGWHGDWKMYRVLTTAWNLADEKPANETEKYTVAAEALKVRHLHAQDRAQTWIARNMRNLNESLWAGRQRQTCIACAQLSLGIRALKPLAIKAREIDKRSDWNTVK